ncbi:MAG TPA: hypothetical protein VMJ65_01475 [Solirubrobacteraceae bacterium]|nr:hypothetical protein [Solirubrobacteraceae bacterium]
MSRRERLAEHDRYREWEGGYRSYDIVKEACIAFGVMLALAVVLTILFSSPDEKPSTVQSWARTDPVDFVTTATTELDGSSDTGGYGPPYNHASDGQHILFVRPQKWLGVSHPVNTAQDFVLAPLRSITGPPALQTAVSAYESASSDQQAKWTTAYENGLAKATASAGSTAISVPAGNYGPLPTMMAGLLGFAQSGGLDGALLSSKQFYQTDYTKPLLFMADGGVLSNRAQAEHLLGGQWGMMNETGSYPGQVWLWLYTFWYQIKPFSTSANADILVMAIMGVLSLALILVPFIPGIRDIPRWIPIYKLIWRDHYRSLAR